MFYGNVISKFINSMTFLYIAIPIIFISLLIDHYPHSKLTKAIKFLIKLFLKSIFNQVAIIYGLSYLLAYIFQDNINYLIAMIGASIIITLLHMEENIIKTLNDHSEKLDTIKSNTSDTFDAIWERWLK